MMSGIASGLQDLRIMHREGSVGMSMGASPCNHFETSCCYWARATDQWGPAAGKGELPGQRDWGWNEPPVGRTRLLRQGTQYLGSVGWLATCRAEARVNPNPVHCCRASEPASQRAQSNLASLGRLGREPDDLPTSPTHPLSAQAARTLPSLYTDHHTTRPLLTYGLTGLSGCPRPRDKTPSCLDPTHLR